jgi:hypothetical protein
MANIRLDYPIGSLTQDEAKARLQALGEYLTSKHGIAVVWTGDRATIKGKYLVVGIEGTFSFEGKNAVFDGKDPGFLWRGKAKEYINNKLKQYLDAGTKLEDLPRKAS